MHAVPQQPSVAFHNCERQKSFFIIAEIEKFMVFFVPFWRDLTANSSKERERDRETLFVLMRARDASSLHSE
jgi:hypothetical protein